MKKIEGEEHVQAIHKEKDSATCSVALYRMRNIIYLVDPDEDAAETLIQLGIKEEFPQSFAAGLVDARMVSVTDMERYNRFLLQSSTTPLMAVFRQEREPLERSKIALKHTSPYGYSFNAPIWTLDSQPAFDGTILALETLLPNFEIKV